MADHLQSVPRSRRLGRPRTNACDACRSAKVKCDERHPNCSRCSRLKLQCFWPPKRAEPIVTQASSEKKRTILPKPAAQQIPSNDKGSGMYREASNSPSTNIIDQAVGTPNGTIWDQSLGEVTLPPQTGSELDIFWASPCSDFSSLLYSSCLFMHDIVLDESLVLSGGEYQALSHYQNTFIPDRILRTPRWSMLGCIFQAISNVPMAMHLLIAISSMDLNQRSPRPVISMSVNRTHFRKGSEMLVQLMNVENEPHHFSTLSSWLFLYLYMTHRDILDKTAVDKLSIAILNYIKRYNLDSMSAGTRAEEKSLVSAWQDPCLSTEPGLVGRLLLFLASEDIRAGFEECGGHLAKYLFGSHDLYWRIFSQQRYILERHWGQSYPEYEAMCDLETTAAIELGNKVGLLFHKVNELSKMASEEAKPHDLEIEKEITEIETQYSPILRMTRSSTAPRTPFLRTADAAVINLYFVKLYHFRLTMSDGTQATPPHITFAMTELMNIAHRAFGEQDHWGYEVFQLPLFMTGIETKDRIHVEWIVSRITRLRFRTALSQIISIQDLTGSRLSIARIRQILEGPVASDSAVY